MFCPDLRRSPNLSKYDVLFFSVSFELDYPQLLRMLMTAGIPLEREAREEGGPFLVIGGITVTANPKILSPFADIIYVGDMECSIAEVVGLMLEHGFMRERALFDQLAGLSGVYVPAVHGREPVPKAHMKRISEPAHTVVLTENTEFANRFLVEIGRGCRNQCRFCMTRCVNNPLRNIPVARVMETLDHAVSLTRRVGLIAPVLTDHPGLGDMVRAMNGRGMTVSFSSLRADDFNEEVAALLRYNGQYSVTFAPETGTVELRRRIGKKLTNEELLRAVDIALTHDIRRFRYYLMFGLPGESEQDIAAVGVLARETVKLFGGLKAELHLSINPFVPKLGTVLGSYRLYPLEYYTGVKRALEQGLRGVERVRYRIESLKQLHLHYYLSVGDERVGSLLGCCVEKGSFRGFSEAARETAGY